MTRRTFTTLKHIESDLIRTLLYLWKRKPEFEHSIQQAERDLADGKSARLA